MLLLPRSLTSSFLGFEVVGAWRIALGIVFLVFLSFSIVEIVLDAVSRIASGRQRAAARRAQQVAEKEDDKRIVQLLLGLSDREQDYIAMYQRGNTISMDMPINDGIVASLQSKGLIHRASSVGKGVHFAFNIHPRAWDYIKAHPEYLLPAIKRVAEQMERRSSF